MTASHLAHRIPEDWEPHGFPAGTVAHAIAASMDPEHLQLEAERFRAYWRSKTGKKASKIDWQATWTMWILNTYKYPRQWAPGGKGRR
jgi:hypothetical protein